MGQSILRRSPVGLAALVLAATPLAALAGSDIFVCQDADGRKTYQNTGAGRGCARLDIQPTLSVPGPRHQTARSSNDARAISPASFPRVDSQTQQARDSDRRRILEDELGAEEAKLQALLAEYRNGAPERLASERGDAGYRERVAKMQADVQRTENNITSLKRELALLSRQ
jgi:hypothetical protein